MPSIPAHFDDSLNARARPIRYRNVGGPYAFLNSIGIDAILEYIYKARNLIDVAKEINVSVTCLLNWLENEGHMQKIENATRFSAEGYLSEASTMLRNAQTDFELKKAKEIASHGRFMASKLDKTKYGQDQQKMGNATGVTFIMHMGDKTLNVSAIAHAQDALPPPELGFINAEYSLIKGEPITPIPLDVAPPDTLGPFEPVPFEPVAADIPEHLAEINPLDP